MRANVVLCSTILGSSILAACDKPAVPTAATPVSPSPVFHVTGVATDGDGAPVSGAIVTVAAVGLGTTVSTDSQGFYSADVPATATGFVRADSPGFEQYFDYLPPAIGGNVSKNLHLYRITRITAGESTRVTIVPGDSNCGLDDELTCRMVRVMIPADGLLTMSCDPRGDDNGGPGLSIVGYNDRTSSGSPRRVTAGTEIPIDIGMWFTSTGSQGCVFTTALTRS